MALIASIEADRAGGYGRGFAIDADEVIIQERYEAIKIVNLNIANMTKEVSKVIHGTKNLQEIVGNPQLKISKCMEDFNNFKT